MQLWGILNLTPDSFYPASRVTQEESVKRAMQMLAEGADRLDIGAESSRPGSVRITPHEEWKRLEFTLVSLKKTLGDQEFQRRSSLDTMNTETARRGLDAGVGCINDVSGGSLEMYKLVSTYKCKYVLMHTSGEPRVMQDHTDYDDVVPTVKDFFRDRKSLMVSHGFPPENIIYDTGIGFGKTVEQNLQLLRALREMRNEFAPILAGVSRKSFIGKIIGEDKPENRGVGTEVVHSYLLSQPADILRVHDVRAAMQTVKLHMALTENGRKIS